MRNRIFVEGLEIIKKSKKGRCSILLFENGYTKGSSDIYNKTVEIECHDCNKRAKVKFYGALFKRKYICMSCLKLGRKNPFYGKQHSAEFKERLSQERKGKWGTGKNNGMYGINVWDSYDKVRADKMKKTISKKNKGNKNGFWGKKHTLKTKIKLSKRAKQWAADHPEHMRKMMVASLKRQRSGLKTKIEKIIEEKLKELKIPYKYSKILHRKYQYDFIIEENILLEVQGDYWHANPLIYGDGKKPINDTQQYKIELDATKKEFAIKYGYKIFYIWETDIHKQDFSVVYKIKKMIELERNSNGKI